MSLAFVRSNVTSQSTNATDRAPTLNASTGVGNALLCFLGCSKGSTFTFTYPTGWTNQFDANAGNSATRARLEMNHKFAASGDAGTAPDWHASTAISWNLDILEYSGVDTTTPFVIGTAGSAGSATAPSVTTDAANSVVLYALALTAANSITDDSNLTGAGWVKRVDLVTSGGTGTDVHLYVYEVTQASAGATGTVAPNTVSSALNAVAGLIVVRPAAAAGDATPAPSAVTAVGSVGAAALSTGATTSPAATAVVAAVHTPAVGVASNAVTYVRQQGTTSVVADGTIVSFDLNSGATAPLDGHLLLTFIGNTKSSSLTWTPAAGFTNEVPAVAESTTTNGSMQLVVDFRKAAADQGAHYEWDSTGVTAALTAAMLEYAGVSGSVEFDAAPVTDNNHATTLPGITTVSDGALVVYAAMISNSLTVTAPPAGFTTRVNQANGFATLYVADMTQGSAGPTGTVGPTLSGTPLHMVSALLALRPAVTVTAATPQPSTVAGTGAVGAPAFTIDTTPAPDAAAAVAAVGSPTILSTPSQSPIAKVQGWITSTSGTASFPTAPVEGNGLLLAVNADTTVTAPSGWTEAASLVNVTGLYLFTKTAGAAEPTDVVITASNAAMAIAEFEATTGVIETLTGHVTRPSGNSPLDVALTGPTTFADDLTVALAGSIGPAPVQWDGWTNGFAEQADTATTAATSVSLAVATQDTTGFAQWDTSAQTFNRAGGSLASCAAQALIVAVTATAGSATVRADTATGVAAELAPTVVVPVDTTATPTVVTATSATGQPVVDTPGHTVVAPATVQAVAGVGAIASAVVDTAVTPPTVKAVGKVLPPALAGTTPLTTVQPDTVAGVAAVGDPTVTATSAANTTVTPAPVVAAAAVAAPTVTAGLSITVSPGTVTGAGVVDTPSELATDVAVQALVVAAKATVGAPNIDITVPTFRFVPPTVFDAPVVSVASHPLNRLMKFYAPAERGQSVWVLKTGEITVQQPPYWDQVDHVYYGGHEYTVDLAEAQRLAAAGFEIGAAQ